MNVGRMRHMITIQAPTETADTFGQMVKGWATVGTFYANVRTPTGREQENAKQLQAIVTDIVEMRNVLKSTPIDASMQVLYNGRTLKIGSVVDPENRGQKLELRCQEQVLPAT